MGRLAPIVWAAILLACASIGYAAGQGAAPQRWESAIAAFEREDRARPPEKGQVLFVGSSTIRLSEPGKWLPGVKALNRGFGGSEIADSVRYADRIILPYEPCVIVFYGGTNDIAAGKEPEAICADFGTLVRKVHKALPQTRIIFMSAIGARSRWKLWPKMQKANALIEEFCRGDDRLWFVDTTRFLLDDRKEPREELFRSDRLHLNDEGYRIWFSVLSPVLTRMLWRPAEGSRPAPTGDTKPAAGAMAPPEQDGAKPTVPASHRRSGASAAR